MLTKEARSTSSAWFFNFCLLFKVMSQGGACKKRRDSGRELAAETGTELSTGSSQSRV